MSNSLTLKSNIHALVDQSNDEELLHIVYHLLHSRGERKDGELLGNLSPDEKKELYKAYEDSFDEANLIELKEFNEKHTKWLEGQG